MHALTDNRWNGAQSAKHAVSVSIANLAIEDLPRNMSLMRLPARY